MSPIARSRVHLIYVMGQTATRHAAANSSEAAAPGNHPQVIYMGSSSKALSSTLAVSTTEMPRPRGNTDIHGEHGAQATSNSPLGHGCRCTPGQRRRRQF